MGYKTSVYKLWDEWVVSYYMPYSGLMLAAFDTWQEAMDEAWSVENHKLFT